MTDHKYYLQKLTTELKLRTDRNPAYSVRSFARDLEIDSSSLSSILKGKRKIPKNKLEIIATKICSNENEMDLFLKSAVSEYINLKDIKSHNEIENRHLVDEQDFAIISDIHTYTLLSLIETEEFKYDKTWIAKKLKQDVKTVEKTIQSLLDVGLVHEANNTLVRIKKRTTTTDEIASKYISKHHVDSLELAKTKCVELSPSERYFSTMTIPCDPESLGAIKKLIMEFEDKIESFLRPSKKTDVFKMSIQFYQATERTE